MKIEYELPDYICLYITNNGLIDCVLCSDYEVADKIYNDYQTATIVEMNCLKQTRSIIKQKHPDFVNKFI